jgi:nitrile hydratase beta subunit/nitrile hydratase accessory protein
MNGVHDMGGMDGFGKVEIEENEPAFHQRWEGRVMAMVRAMGANGGLNIDMQRFSRESLPPATYLSSSYYKKWFLGLERTLLGRNMVGADEIAAGHSLRNSAPLPRGTFSIKDVVRILTRGSFQRDVSTKPRFAPGDKVRAKNINPVTHTRLPRYVRGHVGTIERIQGSHALHGDVLRSRIVGRRRRSDPGRLDRSLRALPRSRMSAKSGATSIPGIPLDDDGPVFREPWEAQAFAMTLALHERGLFTWPEWADTLAQEIRRAQAAGDPDTGETYYRHWLNALERLVREKGVADVNALGRYFHAWEHAAARTPHGLPIELKPDDFA